MVSRCYLRDSATGHLVDLTLRTLDPVSSSCAHQFARRAPARPPAQRRPGAQEAVVTKRDSLASASIDSAVIARV
jgi:hypothetical protein